MNKALGSMKFHVLEDDANKLANVKKVGITEKASVFGELQNRGTVRTIAAKDALQKELKDVKPRVDTRWKKSQVDAAKNALVQRKVLTRSQSQRGGTEAVAAKTVTVVTRHGLGENAENKQKTGTTATNKLQEQVHGNKIIKKISKPPADKAAVTKTGMTLRREDSNLSQKTLAKFKVAGAATRNENVKNVGVVKPLPVDKPAVEKADLKVSNKLKKPVDKELEDAELVIKKPVTHSWKMLNDVEDIDAGDNDNLVLVSEYVNDIYNYLYQLELAQPIHKDHLKNQVEITPRMRSVLIDWINEVNVQFHLAAETFHMTVAIIDRYLQIVKDTKRSNLQLVGVTALFLSAKYEELFPPSVADFAYITDDAYDIKQILKMEREMFKALGFNLSRPLPIHFLRRFSKAGKAEECHHTAAKYFLELTAIEYELTSYKPSEIAAASLMLSLHLFNEAAVVPSGYNAPLWTPTLEWYSRYNATELQPLVCKIAVLVRNAPRSKLDAVYRKYQSTKLQKIAQRPELQGELINSIIETEKSNKKA